jgi:hypothetical protein
MSVQKPQAMAHFMANSRKGAVRVQNEKAMKRLPRKVAVAAKAISTIADSFGPNCGEGIGCHLTDVKKKEFMVTYERWLDSSPVSKLCEKIESEVTVGKLMSATSWTVPPLAK